MTLDLNIEKFGIEYDSFDTFTVHWKANVDVTTRFNVSERRNRVSYMVMVLANDEEIASATLVVPKCRTGQCDKKECCC